MAAFPTVLDSNRMTRATALFVNACVPPYVRMPKCVERVFAYHYHYFLFFVIFFLSETLVYRRVLRTHV